MTTFRCPHCGVSLKVIPMARARANGFNNTAMSDITVSSSPPRGLLTSLLWFLSGNRPTATGPALSPNPVIRVEHWSEDKRHALLDQLDSRISIDELYRVAIQIVVMGKLWSRPNLCKSARLSQNKYHIITDEFKRLNYLHVTKSNRSVLTPRAKGFLKSVVRQQATNNKQAKGA